MTLAMDLARFVVTYPADQIPEVAFERAEMIIASTLASVAVGVDIESARIIRDLEKENGGVNDATVWFDSARLPITAAAKANAVASDAAASDDSDMRSIAHIGTIVSTTAIAAAEKLGNSGREILEAMVLGYEIAGRIDESLTPFALHFQNIIKTNRPKIDQSAEGILEGREFYAYDAITYKAIDGLMNLDQAIAEVQNIANTNKQIYSQLKF